MRAPNPYRSDEAVEILRRLEPVLSSVQNDLHDVQAKQKFQRTDIVRLGDRMHKVEIDIAEIKGGISQIPTFWQLAGLVFAIFRASFVLIRFASGH
ncbi:MAG: hypothetical protein K2Q10_13570 [Rhodospirillales bacterium]|nr:hypothetical protein [Rhodospirillales bacterium]